MNDSIVSMERHAAAAHQHYDDKTANTMIKINYSVLCLRSELCVRALSVWAFVRMSMLLSTHTHTHKHMHDDVCVPVDRYCYYQRIGLIPEVSISHTNISRINSIECHRRSSSVKL